MRIITLSLAVLTIITAASFSSKKDLIITSSAFSNNGSIPVKYTCVGQEASPPLEIGNIPANTKSLAIIVDDPDEQDGKIVTTTVNPTPSKGHKKHAPAKPLTQKTLQSTCGFTNWVIWNIDTTSSLPENFRNEDQGTNSSNLIGYKGMCPSLGTHHYHFRVFALDTKLNIGKTTAKADLEKVMQGHILAKGELVGVFNKTYK